MPVGVFKSVHKRRVVDVRIEMEHVQRLFFKGAYNRETDCMVAAQDDGERAPAQDAAHGACRSVERRLHARGHDIHVAAVRHRDALQPVPVGVDVEVARRRLPLRRRVAQVAGVAVAAHVPHRSWPEPSAGPVRRPLVEGHAQERYGRLQRLQVLARRRLEHRPRRH